MLEINELEVFYDRLHVLKGLSLQVSDGEVVALLGSNGAGKSTLLRTISGLVTPKSGDIKFKGKRINGLPTYDIVKIGIAHCPEGRRVFPYMSVQENLVTMGAFLRKDKDGIRRDLDEVYALFPILKDRKKQKAGTLSGGEQQMLAIGRSMMSNPKLLLLDEPSLGLSPLLIGNIAHLIKKLSESGLTVFMSEQNANMALNISDRAYVLEVGKVALEGKGKELLEDDHVRKAYLGM
jgi:branched-chain amino acid transport system ATP-binding protein